MLCRGGGGGGGGDEFSILNSALVIHVIYISCSILFCQLYSCACMLIDIHIFIMSCSIFIVFGSTPVVSYLFIMV